MSVAEIVDAYPTLARTPCRERCVSLRTKRKRRRREILLDENMPRKLLAALVAEGHEVDSVKSPQLAGIDNGAL